MTNNSFFPNNPRIYLWVALGLLLFLNVQYWLKDYAPQATDTTTATAGATATPASAPNDLGNRVPAASRPATTNRMAT